MNDIQELFPKPIWEPAVEGEADLLLPWEASDLLDYLAQFLVEYRPSGFRLSRGWL